MSGKYIALLGSLGFCFLICLGVALATDPPHNDPESIFCNSCHVAHMSLGASLTTNASNSNLCMSCHTTSGQASNWPFSSTDQATPGTSGKSHRWDGAMPAADSAGNAYGLRSAASLTNATLKTMLTKFSNVVTCSVCHQQHSQSRSPWDPFALGSWPGGDSGSASAAGTTTTVVTAKTWTVNQWQGYYVTMTGGTAANVGLSRLIASNTATTLTIAALPSATALNDTFTINGVAAGTATAGTTASAIVDSTKGWVTNAWTNYYVQFTSGINNGLSRQVASNTANTLTMATAFPAAPVAGDSYYITRNTTANDFGSASAAGTTTTVVTTKAWTVNQWTGYFVKMTSGLNNGLERQIASNSATTLTTAAFPNASASGDTFYIKSNRHFMRINNALNEMCLDCHAYRNLSDVTTYTGNPQSHPVGKALNNVKDPSQFFMIGREPSSASFAAQQGGRGEINGGSNTNYTNNAVVGLDNEISCLSCHGMHYTDSNSATVDLP